LYVIRFFGLFFYYYFFQLGEIIEMGGVQMYTHTHKKYIKLDHKKVGRWCSTSSWQFNCIRESALKKIQIKRNLNCCWFFFNSFKRGYSFPVHCRGRERNMYVFLLLLLSVLECVE
jgi:hypothetical protein